MTDNENDDDGKFVVERQVQRDDIETGAFDKVRAEAPDKSDAIELFDHASKKYNAERRDD